MKSSFQKRDRSSQSRSSNLEKFFLVLKPRILTIRLTSTKSLTSSTQRTTTLKLLVEGKVMLRMIMKSKVKDKVREFSVLNND